MADSLLPSQDGLLSQTMTHAAPKPNYAANVESAISSAVGPSWLEQASAEHQKASQAFEKGGAHALLAFDPTETFDLAGGFNAAGMFVPINAEAASLATRMLKQGASKDSIWKIFGIFQGADGFWRREIHDLGARLTPEGKSGKARTVGEALEHPELFQENPELANIPLKYSRSDMFGGAYYHPGTRGGERIVLNRVGDTVSIGSLLHEIMHGIQERGDFAKGGSPESMFAMAKEAFVHFGGDPSDHAAIERLAYAAYRRLAGEVEANNVKGRYLKMLKWMKENPGKDLSEWIKENPPESTEEYPRDQQNVVGAGKKPAVSESRPVNPDTLGKVEQIRALRAKGESEASIASKLGVSPSYIRKLAANYQLPAPVKPPPTKVFGDIRTDPVKLNTLQEMLRSGKSYSEIAAKLGVSRNSIAGIVDRLRKADPTSFTAGQRGQPSLPDTSDLSKLFPELTFTPVEHEPFE